VSNLLPRWRELIAQLSIPGELAQLEFAIGEGETPGSLVTAFVLRHLEPLSTEDLQMLITFAQIHDIDMWLQPAGLDSAHPLHPADSHLCYRLPEFDIEMPFKPTDFTQVNHQVNRVLVSKAIQLLDPQASERVIDLFCGIGNFTLPLARRAAEVFGIEGSEELIKRAKENAIHNHLGDRVNFASSNLFEVTPELIESWGKADKWLIDPPRDGAMALATSLAMMALSGDPEVKSYLPKRIVYVSCNPATLARDVGILVGQAGYKLKAAGVINMFPHTSHVESMAVFER
jgi:23S rRNA (uracil1939-C5)-methyltransferase